MAPVFSRTRSTATTKGASANDRQPKVDELVDVLKPKPNTWYDLRLIYTNFSFAQHWIPIETKGGKVTKIPKNCLSYSDEIEAHDSTVDCPYCAMGVRADIHYYMNAINRKLQDRLPADLMVSRAEAKTGFKDRDSDSVTPVQVLRLPAGAVRFLSSLVELNTHGKRGEKVAYPLEDPDYGCDIRYMYSPEATGSSKHQFQLGQGSPLTEEEMNYLVYNIENLLTPEDPATAEREAQELAGRMVEDPDANDRQPSGGRGGRQQQGGKAPAYAAPSGRRGAPVVDDGDDDVPARPARPAAPPARGGTEKPGVGDTVAFKYDGDAYGGKVTAIDEDTVTVDYGGDEPFDFPLASVKAMTITERRKAPAARPAPPPARPARPAPRQAPQDDPDEDEAPFDPDEDVPARPAAPPARGAVAARQPVAERPPRTPPAARPARPTYDDDEDEDVPARPARPAAPPARGAAAARPTRPAPARFDDDED